MDQRNNEYYPKDKPFTEISVKFWGDRMKPTDIMCYLKLKSLSKKLDINYPDFFVDSNFLSYGDFLRYECSTILEDNNEKNRKIKAICSELIKYGIKNKYIPMIEFINYGEKTTIFKLKDYLRSKGIKLEGLNIEEITNQEINLEETR